MSVENRGRGANTMRRRLVGAVLAAALLLPAACTSGNDASVAQGGSFQMVTPGGETEFSYPPDERRPLGEIAGPAVSGDGTVAVADYPDTVVVLNFWGSWCAPCRAEADDLATAFRDTEDLGVQFIGINVKERDPADGADFERARQTPYPSIADRQMRTLLSIPGYPVNGVPSTIVLDRQHRVAHIWLESFSSPAPLVEVVTEVAGEGG